MVEDPNGDAIDPICGMRVNSKNPAAKLETADGPVYFCSVGCHGRFLAGPDAAPGTQQISLGRKPRD
jgi:YHS domain-containing protein